MRSYFARMIMLPKDEYLEIKEFLRHRVCEINRSENYDRKKQREKKNKYSLPNADSFGWMPSISICYSFDIGNNQIMYMIPYLPFYNFLVYHLPQALYTCSQGVRHFVITPLSINNKPL